MHSPKGLMCKVAVSLLLLSSVAGWARSSSPQQAAPTAQLPTVSPQELVRRAVDNELKAGNDQDVRYMFKDRRQTPDGSRTKLMVETKQGTVAYLLAVNDKPITPEVRQQENGRLRNLLASPEEQTRKRKAQESDNERINRMFRELPNAFKYRYEGVVPGKSGHDLVRLKFEPNPGYRPPSREASVFKAMKGDMLIDPQAERLVRIEATLFSDVSFGWGILGHLDKGGHFIVEQTNVSDGRWEPTYMNLQFTGKALLFKTINLRQIESTSDYSQVPSDLTLAQGIDMLKRRVDSTIAENGASR